MSHLLAAILSSGGNVGDVAGILIFIFVFLVQFIAAIAANKKKKRQAMLEAAHVAEEEAKIKQLYDDAKDNIDDGFDPETEAAAEESIKASTQHRLEKQVQTQSEILDFIKEQFLKNVDNHPEENNRETGKIPSLVTNIETAPIFHTDPVPSVPPVVKTTPPPLPKTPKQAKVAPALRRVSKPAPKHSPLREKLKNPSALKEYIIASNILGTPRGLL